MLPLTAPWETFLGTVPSVDGFWLCPSGGERYGGLIVCSAFTVDLGSPAGALTALYKGAYGLWEEVAYASWDRGLAERCASSFAAWRRAQRAPEGTSERFVDWLRGRANEVLEAQRTLSTPLNAPMFLHPSRHPSRPNELPTNVDALVSAQTLVAALDDRWNSPEGLFGTEDRTWLVAWWTSA